jgi:O-6-methylguanine DNA methyltransferase
VQKKYLLSAMRLSDGQRLRQAGFWQQAKMTLKTIKELMRLLQCLCNREVWLAASADGQVAAIAGFQVIDLTTCRAVLHLHLGLAAFDDSCLAAILNKAFGDLDLYRLELALTPELKSFLPLFIEAGWREEGKMRFGLFDLLSQRHQDVVMYSILRPDWPEPGTAFVPFSKGVFAVTGTNEKLQETDFIRFGDTIRLQSQRESAELLGLLDESGKLISRQMIMEKTNKESFIACANIPEMIVQAAVQATEYFSGKRTTFDLPLDLEQGSDYQRRVWLKLAEIPYGSTWNYEELAYNLGPPDWTAARKSARAVGSACSANPFPLILPCHRVIGKDGKLVGFTSGLDIKEYLLAHEMMGLNE